MYSYVGPVVCLSSGEVRIRSPSSRRGPPFGVLFARRTSPCSPLPTLPGAASPVLASSPGDGCSFRFFVEMSQASIVRIGKNTC